MKVHTCVLPFLTYTLKYWKSAKITVNVKDQGQMSPKAYYL